MIIDGYWLPITWAVLAGAWAITAIVRVILVVLSWPAERWWRLLGVAVYVVCSGFFFWRKTAAGDIPAHIPIEEMFRNFAALALVIYILLDNLKAVYGITERRALNIWRERQAQAEQEEKCKTAT